MRSLILATATRFLMPLILVFSLFALLRGHNEPGGGFIGGLIAASAFVLYAISEGPEAARYVLRIDPRTILGVGLVTALLSGVVAWFAREPYMTGHWSGFEVPGIGAIGTPLLFDLGVYLVVIGFVLTVVFSLAEE